MPNNTNTYWSASGESLHTYAHSIESLGPGLKVPELRGENIVIPGRPGTVWVPKDVDSRILSLGMWVRGTTDDVNATQALKSSFDLNWNNLVRLLWTPGRQFPLTKRFYDRRSTTDNTKDLTTATALAEFKSGLEPSMIGRNAAKFVVDLELADPFFYSSGLVTSSLTEATAIDVRGNADTTNAIFTINGPARNVTLRNTTLGIQVQFIGDLSSGDVVKINAFTYEALLTKSGVPGSIDVSSQIRHAGSSSWFKLAPGINNLTTDADSGGISLQLEYRGAWT